jgi:SAM-dependent methyltransferase
MAEKPQHFDPLDAAQAERRAAARVRLDAIDPAKTGGALKDPYRREWFSAVYALSDGDPLNVPWGNQVANPLLREWLAQHERLDGLQALDVGCGLGDNAAALAAHGARAIGFDLVPAAAEWAQKRFPELEFRAADLFAPPAEWRGAFDFVNEIYTLQALPGSVLPEARAALAALLKPGGRLLVICRSRRDDQLVGGPPWPLTRADLMAFEEVGLTLVECENTPPTLTPNPHWRAVFRKN